MLEEVGQPEQAKAQLVDALTIDPHNARALTALGRLRDQSGDHAQAMANYKRSLELNRFQPEVEARVAQLQGAMGAPVVVSSIGAQREIIEEGRTGYSVPPFDPPALAEAMTRLISAGPEGRKTMGLAAASRIREKFTTAALQKATLDVYDRLLGRPA